MKGREYCRTHGGKTKVGPAHPNFKEGRNSRYVPASLRATYDQIKGNPEELSLDHEISLLSARLDQVMQKLGTGETERTWRDLREKWREFIAAVKQQDGQTQNDLLPDLNRLIGRGYSDVTAWNEAASLMTRIERLKTSERRRIVEAREVTSVEHVMALLTANLEAFVKSVERNVDGEAAGRIIDDAQRIYTGLVGEPTSH